MAAQHWSASGRGVDGRSMDRCAYTLHRSPVRFQRTHMLRALKLPWTHGKHAEGITGARYTLGCCMLVLVPDTPPRRSSPLGVFLPPPPVVHTYEHLTI